MKKIKIDEVNFPTLYKLNNQGKVEQWSICVRANSTNKGHSVHTTFGEYRGKMQTKSYNVLKGKNIGKKNETNSGEQAWLEAEAKHNGMLKKGYVKNLKDAKAGKTDSIIQGGIVPMLAHSYDDHKDKIKFPVMVQPKLDGQRCIAHFKNGKVTLWTRTRKPILSCPHIIKSLESLVTDKTWEFYLDGELYNHDLKNDFEKLMSAVRKQKPSEESLKVQFHIYDCHSDQSVEVLTFKRRFEILCGLPDTYCGNIFHVTTSEAFNHEDLEQAQKQYIQEGFEGLMIRDPESLYVNKRSKGLLKMKTFDDAEFEILDVIPGKDNTVMFKCKCKKETFEATMSGDKKENQKYLKNKKKFIGKQLTVKFQGLTGKNGVPRFPVGLRIRGEE